MEGFNFPDLLYKSQLKEINGIKFTPREIEIIAFILSARSGKKIASFLSISPKTTENHTQNIMRKVGCHSREELINFIEKSGKYLLVRQYYLSWLIHREFEEVLKKLAPSNEGVTCSLVHWPSQEDGYPFFSYLKSHLKLAGVKVTTDKRQKEQHLFDLISEPTIKGYNVYFLPKRVFEELQSPHEYTSYYQNPISKIFILPIRSRSNALPSELECCDSLDLMQYKNYYFLVFEVLKRLFLKHPIEKMILDFHDKVAALSSSTLNLQEKATHLVNKRLPSKPLSKLIVQKALKHKRNYIFMILICLGGGVGIHYFYPGTLQKSNQSHPSKGEEIGLIRSDLLIPMDSVLLDRTNLLAQIESHFKVHPERIQTIALVGIGGSGKTTLARQYARLQKGFVAWEINAETKESLSFSFENLAYVLCKTEDEKKELRVIQDIKNVTEREEKIIQWVKKHLKSRPNWLLIFDNVESFSDIQNHFPSDSKAWGAGQIILTTRDDHIRNNNQVNEVLLIGELNPDQKLRLFFQIMSQPDSRYVRDLEKAKAKQFLEQIPSFPLDVVVAAHYLKSTGTSYEKYLDYLTKQNNDFENVQKNVLKEIGNYTKTRYSIIVMSIQKLIKANTDFRDLLLFISLLDSQNIPRELLRTCKNDVVVDDFIFHLKKYFLITNQSSSDSLPTFSIHRSTQVLSLAYLINTLGLEKDNTFIRPLSDALIKFISTTIDAHDFQSMNLLVNHCEMFLKHLTLLNDYIRGNIQGELGGLYFYLGRYNNSIQNLEESLTKLNKPSHKNHMEVARSLRYLGNVYRDLGGYDKSRDLFEQSHALYEGYFPNEHSGIARSFTYLGLIHRNLGNYEKARDFLKKSLIIYEKHVADKKQKMLGIARALAYLGSVERILGDFESARARLDKSLVIFKEYFSETHLKVGWILAYLGNFHRDVGNYDIARDCLERSYQIYIKHFSINHLKVAWVSLLLGNLYHEIGEYKKANQHLQQCLAVYEKEYGKDHIETAKVLRNLGQSSAPTENQEPALQLINTSLKIFDKNKHPESFITLEALAGVYLKQSTQSINMGDKAQAESSKAQAMNCLNQALEVVGVNFAKNTIHTLRIQNKIAKIREATKVSS